MTEFADFSELIKKHRFELPNASDISSFADELTEYLNEITLDYTQGNYAKWVALLSGPIINGRRLSRQEAIDCISMLCEEKNTIIELTHSLAQEVDHYDRKFGRPIRTEKRRSSGHNIERDSFLVGLAFGYTHDTNEPVISTAPEVHPIPNKWTFEKIMAVIMLVLELHSKYQSGQPNLQMSELIDLQKQESLVIQGVDAKIDTQMDQIGDWLISFREAYEERTEAIIGQTDAIKENTQAIEQLVDKMDAVAESMETQETEATETTPECDCSCHDMQK